MDMSKEEVRRIIISDMVKKKNFFLSLFYCLMLLYRTFL
jgi:hypothetical protein